MFRFVFRLLATVALSVAVIMAVLDATRTIAAGRFVVTPLLTSWAAVSPETLASAQAFVEGKVHPLAWDPIAAGMLALPGFLVFSILALLLYAIGHRPQRRIGRFAAES